MQIILTIYSVNLNFLVMYNTLQNFKHINNMGLSGMVQLSS